MVIIFTILVLSYITLLVKDILTIDKIDKLLNKGSFVTEDQDKLMSYHKRLPRIQLTSIVILLLAVAVCYVQEWWSLGIIGLVFVLIHFILFILARKIGTALERLIASNKKETIETG